MRYPLERSLLILSLVLLGVACAEESDGPVTLADGGETGALDAGTDLLPDVLADQSDERGLEAGEITGDGEGFEASVDAFDGGDTGEEPAHQVVECSTLEPVPEGTCVAEAGGSSLLIRGTILAPGETLVGGQLLVSSEGSILCVDCDCSAADQAVTATLVTCPAGIVSPGLINAHDHLTYTQNSPSDWGAERFEHRHDWRKGIRGHKKIPVSGGANEQQVTWGEMRHAMSGVTSIAGSGKADGFVRNLDKDAQEGLGQDPVYYNTFPLGDSDGTLLSDGCGYPAIDGGWVLESDCYLPHVGEGIDKETRNEFLCLSSDENGGVDLTEANSAFIHGIGVKAMDGAELAASGTAIIWSPRSNVALYGNTAPVTMYHAQGVLLGIGTDWTASGSINVLRELACASFLNDNYYGHFFQDRELWLMATTWNAAALAVDDVVGALKPGMVADIAIFSGGQNAAADEFRTILDSGPEDVALVLRGGVPVYGDSQVVSELPGGKDKCEPIPGGVCSVSKTICAERETGYPFAELEKANSGSYPLFFCGPPADEPSCVPFRNQPKGGKYTGESTPDDLDGDGLANVEDNCPDVFNPIRPLDDNEQADHDGDGEGDLCDPCPLDPDTTECSVPDPMDKDGDGVATASDNCPFEYNPTQDDLDEDGAGDECDACPEFSNPGGSGCPATIYEIKTSAVEVGKPVLIKGVVTAVAAPSFFIQVPEELQDEQLGYTFSGLFVYVPAANPSAVTVPERGDFIEASGVIVDFWGQLQLNWVDKVEILSTDSAEPAPVVVDTAQVGTGSEEGDDYESVLITVVDGVVTELNPLAGGGDEDPTNEFVLDGILKVNDMMFLQEPFPQIGDILTVTGVLRWANGDYKLEPREASDVIPVLKLRSLSPESVFANEGEVEALTVPPLTVELTAPAPEGGISILLASSDPERLAVPESVLVPAGEKTVPVLVTALLGGPEPVIVTATLDDVVKEAAVLVIPPDQIPIPLLLAPEKPMLSIDSETLVILTLDIPGRPGGTPVAISVDQAGTGVIEFPSEVLVEEDSLTAVFTVKALAEGIAQLTASTLAGATQVQLEVVNMPLTGLIITEVLYNPDGQDSGKEWVELYNGTMETVDLAKYSLGNGGLNYTSSRVQLAGTLAPGQCFVVGGPDSNEENSSPLLDQAVDFEPDFQNSGDTADGVALFPLAASGITPDSVPIDSVIYGTTNDNGLMDKTGQPGAVNVGKASSGNSMQLTPAGWIIPSDPTPNDCAHAFAP
jgi:cytosine/adenosine deaminase-related metal-dependent hydrolase